MNIQAINQIIAAAITANPWLLLILLWSGVWKLIALWKAAKHDHIWVFIGLGVINLLGIPEIIYIVYLYTKERK